VDAADTCNRWKKGTEAALEYILLGIGTVLVIYFYAVTATEGRRAAKKRGKTKKKRGEPEARTLEPPAKPGMRICPICGSEMGPSDKLYAEIYKAVPRDKVFIKGCPRCHALPGKPESQPEFAGEIDL